MPEIARFFGIIIYIYYKDTEQHHMAHIHAVYGEYEGVYSLEGQKIVGDLPIKQEEIVRSFIQVFQPELQEAWNKAIQGQKPEKIKGVHL